MNRLKWLVYFYIQRPIRDLPQKLAWKLPKKVAYWAFIRTVTKAEPSTDPSGLTVKQIMDRLDNQKASI
jgi:hypothetical protein